MANQQTHFLELQALRVVQPLSEFYVISISARDLLQISFSEPLKYIDNAGTVRGSQRTKNKKRLEEIATYIESVEMAFPNSIILGANYNQSGNISKDESERWRIEHDTQCNTYKLIIPKNVRLSAIIDGQHRLNAFEYVTNIERFDDLQLLCSVYFDLPNSYQAFLFATINSNQKKVNRSLALEQFGYNVDDEPEKAWTPEKFAVFLSRKLNVDNSSPFYQHIKVTPLNYEILFPEGVASEWVVSTATLVDGINSLITSNAKRDRIIMQQVSAFKGRSRSLLKNIKDVSPLRNYFIEGFDQTIYDVVIKFFTIFNQLFWPNYQQKSYIFKTVGVQAAFDILKLILNKELSGQLENIQYEKYLTPSVRIDFSDKFFQASGIGRGRIKNIIAFNGGLLVESKIKKTDISLYRTISEGRDTTIDSHLMQWDEDAENAVIEALDKTNWNYDSKTISIDLDEDYERLQTFRDYNTFFIALVKIAENAYVSSLPDDNEFSEQQRENFDPEDLVRSKLGGYEPNLQKIGWQQ